MSVEMDQIRKAANSRIFQNLKKNHTKENTKNGALSTILEDSSQVDFEDCLFSQDTNKKNLCEIASFNSSFHTKSTSQKDRKFSPVSRLSRSGSLSPRSALYSKKREDLSYKTRFRLPLTGIQAALLHGDCLSDYEKTEILKYQKVYFLGKGNERASEPFDDVHGVYKAKIQDHLAYRYEVLGLLGRGTFGHVYKCLDYKRGIQVAVKILRKNPKIRKQGEIEIKNLENINEQDQDDSKNLVRMLQCFEFRNHLCISFELLSLNLYQFIRKSGYKGLSLHLIKRIALQILVALRCIHRLGLIHCDLKLENIVLKYEGKTCIKVIDVGSAVNYGSSLCTYAQSRYYRAPEVILGAGFDNKIDIWSFGCILVELLTGRPLFMGENEHDQLIKIMSVLGLPPQCLLEKSNRRSCFFDKDFKPNLIKNKRGFLLDPGSKDLPLEKEDVVFKEFILGCLQWEASKRFSAEDAMKHPWIRGKR